MSFARLSVAAAALCKSANVMIHKAQDSADELRPEYNFDYSKAVRGKYYRQLLKEGSNVAVLEGSNVAVLEPDVARAFPNSAAVNDALRSVLKTKPSGRVTSRSSRTARKRAAT